MRIRDVMMIVVAFVCMFIGTSLPELAEPLAPLPRLLLMFMLFQGFLAVGTDALWGVMRLRPQTVLALVVIRLVLLPVLCFVIFRLCLPDFALGAFLIAASPVGVMAGVFSLMVRADTALILVANITTSLLLPLSLPFMLLVIACTLQFGGFAPLNLPDDLSLSGMAVSLCVTILVPFILANVLRRQSWRTSQWILAHQYPLSLVAIVFTNIAIFSQYGDVLHQSPRLIFVSLGVAFAVSIIMTLLALPTARRMQPQTGLAFVICYGTVNNILIMILSMEFFSVTEALTAAAYLVPVYMLLLYYRHYARRAGITQ